MARVEFHISYSCDNNCLFCSEGDQLKKFLGQFVASKVIIGKLGAFAKKGFNHVVLTGGEPSYHPDFIEILSKLKNLNYITYVTTNGGLFYKKKFAQQAFPFIDQVCFSLHGHTAKLHNFHTGNKNSFSRQKLALSRFQDSAFDMEGFVNIVVTKYNVNYLTEVINFISRFSKVKQVIISSLAPEGRGLTNFSKLSVPFSFLTTKIGDLVSLANSLGLRISFFGMPLCVLGEYRNYSNDLGWTPRVTIEKWENVKKIILKTTFSFKPTRKRIKTTRCQQCSKKKICGGVFFKYFELFGEKELIPYE